MEYDKGNGACDICGKAIKEDRRLCSKHMLEVQSTRLKIEREQRQVAYA